MEGRRYPEEQRRARKAQVQAAYEVVIDAPPEVPPGSERPEDWQLLVLLGELQSQFAEELTRRAVRRFGPAYFVEVIETRTGGSVHMTVLLAVRYPVRSVTAAVDELRRFAGEIEVVVAEALAGETPLPFLVVAAADEHSLPAPEPADEERTAWDRLAPVLAAVGTGIGVLGFVTFVGGAIDWARFQATGLPQEQALAVVPTQDLVVIGARTLVPAALWGLLACALYVLALTLLGTREQRIWNPKLVLLAENHAATTRAIFLALMVLAFEAWFFLDALGSLSPLRAMVLALFGVLLSLLTFSIARGTARSLYLASTIFIALALFLGGASYIRALSTPELRGAAIVRENRKAIIGFFIAENGSRVYLARLGEQSLDENKIDRSSARLIGVDEEEISSIDVGPPTSPEKAIEQARDLADELCEQELPRPLDKKLEADLQNCWTDRPGIYLEEARPSTAR